MATAKSITRNETNQGHDTSREERETRKSNMWPGWDKMARTDWEIPDAFILRNIDGIPFRMDRAKALGNAVVSEQAKEAFMILSGMK